MTGAQDRTQVIRAREHAASGAWTRVLDDLNPPGSDSTSDPEIAPLYGEALLRVGRARDAHAWLTTATSMLARRGDRAAYRVALNLRGAASFAIGELGDAEESFGRALQLATGDEDLLLVARATNNLGAIANVRGERAEAVSFYELAIPVYQRLGEPRGLAQCHHNLAITHRDRGDIAQADEHERRAVEFAVTAADPRLAALARVGRAELALRSGDAALAEARARHAARELATLGDLANEADAIRIIGAACAALGRVDEALAALTRALDMAVTHGHALVEAETWRDLAMVHARQGDLATARTEGTRAIATFERLGAADEARAVAVWLEMLSPAGPAA